MLDVRSPYMACVGQSRICPDSYRQGRREQCRPHGNVYADCCTDLAAPPGRRSAVCPRRRCSAERCLRSCQARPWYYRCCRRKRTEANGNETRMTLLPRENVTQLPVTHCVAGTQHDSSLVLCTLPRFVSTPLFDRYSFK